LSGGITLGAIASCDFVTPVQEPGPPANLSRGIIM
jgi:hypothetical protein